MLLVNMSISGLLMMLTVPMFLTNLYNRGPYLGVAGAKVSDYILLILPVKHYFRYMDQFLLLLPWQLSGF